MFFGEVNTEPVNTKHHLTLSEVEGLDVNWFEVKITDELSKCRSSCRGCLYLS
jgi:hypothetical protein